MRYNLPELELEVRSEYAAKPTGIRSRFLLKWIEDQPRVQLAVDYGCGRLRYAIPLAAIADSVLGVDSTAQLEKLQKIDGTRTTLIEYSERNEKIDVVDLNRFWTSDIQSNLTICVNVLSAIPDLSQRHKVVDSIASHLNPNGICLFVVQHRNSDFDRVQKTGKAVAYKDGYVIKRKGRASFYGLLKREYIIDLMKSSGLAIGPAFIRGQSTYVVGRRRLAAP